MQITIKSTKPLTKAHPDDMGWDIEASEDMTIYSNGRTYAVPTGIYMEIPKGWGAIIKERSGHALRHNLKVGGGVIDAPYRGELKVLLSTHNMSLDIKKGMKIAQLIFVQVPEIEWLVTSDLSPSDRGDKGFGSSGV